jgi:hypothetical protein
MIREEGPRPTGVEFVRDANTDHTIAVLGGRELFRLSALDVVQAGEVVVDWNDIGRVSAATEIARTVAIDQTGPPPDGPPTILAGRSSIHLSSADTFAPAHSTRTASPSALIVLANDIRIVRRLRTLQNRRSATHTPTPMEGP